MPISLRTLGSGGLSRGDVHAPVSTILTAPGATRWLKTAGYFIPSFAERYLQAFLDGHTTVYGFLEAGSFRRALVEYAINNGTNVLFYDYMSLRNENFTVVFSPTVLHLLRNVEPGELLRIADGSATAAELFCVSVLLEKEVGLYTTLAAPWNELFVSIGRTGKVPGFPGYRFVLHTHPSLSNDTHQIKDDVTKALDGTVELVVTGSVLLCYGRNYIFNTINTARGYKQAATIGSMTVHDALTGAALRDHERTMLARRVEAERAAVEQERRELEEYRRRSAERAETSTETPTEYDLFS